MARYKGHNGVVKVSTTVVAQVEQFDIEMTVEEIAASVLGSDWTAVCPGQATASGSMTIQRDPANAQHTALSQGQIVSLDFNTEGDTSGLTTISGDFLVTSVSHSVPVNDLVKSTVSFRNEGAVTVGTIA